VQYGDQTAATARVSAAYIVAPLPCLFEGKILLAGEGPGNVADKVDALLAGCNLEGFFL
jgi:hypothetical protein